MTFALLNRMKKILVVEDDPAIRKVLATKLRHKGYKVVTVDNGREVLKTVAAEQPAGIILDLMLPAEDGMSILRTLRSPEVQYQKPVVVLTNLQSHDVDYDKPVVELAGRHGVATPHSEAVRLGAQYFNKADTPINTVVDALAKAL